MTEFNMSNYEEDFANDPQPPKKRGRKPGAAKKIIARPSQSSLPIPTDEIVAAVNTLRAMPEDIMKCAIAIVTQIGK